MLAGSFISANSWVGAHFHSVHFTEINHDIEIPQESHGKGLL